MIRNYFYESLYTVTGSVKRIGSKTSLTVIEIGLMERGKLRTWRFLSNLWSDFWESEKCDIINPKRLQALRKIDEKEDRNEMTNINAVGWDVENWSMTHLLQRFQHLLNRNEWNELAKTMNTLDTKIEKADFLRYAFTLLYTRWLQPQNSLVSAREFLSSIVMLALII